MTEKKEQGENNSQQTSMSELKTGSFSRSWAVTQLGMKTGAKMAAHSFGNLFRSEQGRVDADREFYQREAGVLADELGRLKGSIMKAGQMLSLYGQYFLPPEAVTVLSNLQDNTPPVSWSVIEPVLIRSLGAKKLAELDIDQKPLAAASLGQAHRATRKSDGLEMVLKVQYPGVADAIESDVRTLQRIVGMTRLAPNGLNMTEVFSEVREMLYRETDYNSERKFTEQYYEHLKDDDRYVVPSIIGDYCGAQVLATSYEHSVHVNSDAVQSLPLAERSRLAASAIELFLTEFFEWGMVQTDPHFGNYRVRITDGKAQLVSIDFGATRVFGRGFIEGYREILGGSLRRDHDAIFSGAKQIGLMNDNFPEPVMTAFAKMCELIVEPFRSAEESPKSADLFTATGEYIWADSDLLKRVAATASRNALSRYFRVPPREIVFLHRRLAGVFILAGTLRAELDAAPLLKPYVEIKT